MKGAVWIIVGILLMVILSVLLAFFAFSKKIIVEKRAYQEKILSTGNRIEITGNLIIQSTDLATLQALYDVGHSNIAIENDLEYNVDEKLPYWSEEYEDYIKKATLNLAEKYFENYNRSFTDYFMNPALSNERYRHWFVQWEKDMKIENFDENYISINFGQFNITYDDGSVRISKKYPLLSNVKTKFFRTLEKSKEVVNMINEGYDLANIEQALSDNYVFITLKEKNDYIIISSEEKSIRKFYLFSSQTQNYDSLGVAFVLKKGKCFCASSDCSGGCWWGSSGPNQCPGACNEIKIGSSLNYMGDIKKCGNFYILKGNHPCDILNYI